MTKFARLRRKTMFIGYMLTFMVVFSACASGFTTIAPLPPQKYEKLGHASGKATGSLGILGTAYYFIPMGINDRVALAYDRALQSVPGATALIDVRYEESWYWWLIGTARTVTVSGEAIKEVTK